MSAESFISERINFKSKAACASIAVSFVVMIVAIAVAAGFRSNIYDKLGELFGDITVENANAYDYQTLIPSAGKYASMIEEVDGVEAVKPVLYSSGMVKNGDEMHGVLFKAMEGEGGPQGNDIEIPRKLAGLLGLSCGDQVNCYFITDRVAIRKLTVSAIAESIVTEDDKLLVRCSRQMLARVMGCADDEATVLEVILDKDRKGSASSSEVCRDIAYMLYALEEDDDISLVASTVRSRYKTLFDWLDLVDMNVVIMLALMIVVAAFNMISALLILLFQNISTIGILKTMGMGDRGIARCFLLSAGRLVGLSMIIGNLAAFAICLLQKYLHILKLDADNYFISYVPVELDIPVILAWEIFAFAAVMLLLLLPCRFVGSVDPAKTVSYR